MRIRKTSQYIEGGATLSNEYGTSQEDGYSQEYINNNLENKKIKLQKIRGSVTGSGSITFDYSSVTGTIIAGFIMYAQNDGNNQFITSIVPRTGSGSAIYPSSANVTVSSAGSSSTTYVTVGVLYYD